ncbi:B12-binding domain-containing radical SAM protein [bacterium]|nr:MAG: B12-binding domain-containing radical SAM protein [bacterium]
MNILLVYPECPDTFWSFKHALKFISKRATLPPLGLLTVAGMLPREWKKKVVDMNVEPLKDRDIEWADYVFISAMSVQKESAKKVISRCKKLGARVVAGGPLFTTGYEEFEGVDHFVLNEAEVTLPFFLKDLKAGNPGRIYTSNEWADLRKTPVPLWELIDMRKYASMCIQYSRGCPFNCEFCDVTLLFGRRIRTKTKNQIIKELEALYQQGWRGGVFVVDDNFIGNKYLIKKEILPAITGWMKERNYPFTFTTQASINLADDEELVKQMVEAGFTSVFVGIETPNEESLTECGKFQNKNRNLLECVRRLQRHGLIVQGGFILGFDHDPPSIFETLISFIQKSGIIAAMVGLLNAPRGTRLYNRLKKEKRLVAEISGDNTDLSMNFIPKMEYNVLLRGYRKVVQTIYSPEYFYRRLKTFLENFNFPWRRKLHFHFYHLRAFFKSIWRFGIRSRERKYFWKLLLWTLVRRPVLVPIAFTFTIYGFHFRKIFEEAFRKYPLKLSDFGG